jgi:hypothetical protein
MTIRQFLYRLLFTRTDDLDTLQILFNLIVLVTLYTVHTSFSNQTTPPEVQIEALLTLRWMLGLLVITAVPVWLVPYIKNPFNHGAAESAPSSSESPDGVHQSSP